MPRKQQNVAFFSLFSIHLYSFFSTVFLLLFLSCGTYYTTVPEAYQNYCAIEDYQGIDQGISLDVPYVAQMHNHCGPASLSMVMKYHGVYVDQEEIGEGLVGPHGVTISELTQRAKEYGFLSNVFSCSTSGLLRILSGGQLMLARVVNSNNTNGHFIVLTGYDLESETLYINDPENPLNNEISFQDFEEIWDIKSLGDQNTSNMLVEFYPSQI